MADRLSISFKGHSTVDKEDVKRHSKLAGDWWNLNGGMRLLHTYNLVRVPFVRDGLVPSSINEGQKAPLTNLKILDVGCGGGILTEALTRLGAKMSGVDASRELIEIAKAHSGVEPAIKNNRPTYYNSTIEEHSEQFCNYYDAVVASEIIEHVTDTDLFIESCLKALKPGGSIFLTTPSRTRHFQVFGIFFAEYIFGLVPKGTHQYDKLMTPDELTILLKKNNCKVEMIHGLTYNPLTGSWSSTNSTRMFFGVKAVKNEI